VYFFGTSNAFPAIARTEKRFLFVLDDRCGATVNADDVDAMVDAIFLDVSRLCPGVCVVRNWG